MSGLTPLHGIGSRQDLPLPFGLVVTGAAIAVIVSFVVVLAAWRTPRFTEPGGIPLPRLTRLMRRRGVLVTLRIAVALVVSWAAVALVWGQDRLTNPVFGFVFVWVWVGLIPVSLLCGPIWRVLSPAGWIAGLSRGQAPARIGVWPATLGLMAFGWLELVQPDRATLPVLRVWAVAWLVVVVGGGLVGGRRWVSGADPFEAYASTVASLSWLQVVGGRLRAVHPLRALGAWKPPVGTAALTCALLGTTAFDGLGATTWWIRTVQDSPLPRWVWGTTGLVAMWALVGLTYTLACAAMRAPGRSVAQVAHEMSPSLVPLVIGYGIGHYASLLAIEGQRVAIGFSDPLGRGWNVFGTAELGVNAALFAYPAVTATIQLVSVVGGHVLGILVAHDRALRLDVKRRVAGQVPMVAVMVGYTVGGLVLLFSP